MKNIIITGGSGGIGGVLTKHFLNRIYSVTVIGKNKKRFENLKIESSNVQFYSLDISCLNDVQSFFNWFSSSNASLYALINVAGVQPPIGEFASNNDQEWENNLKINIFGTANMIKGAISLLKIGKHNKIINFSGGGATSSRPNFSAYAVSKIAIIKLTEILANELDKYSIDINAVAPGAINTEMLNEIIDAGSDYAGVEYTEAIKRHKEGGESPDKIVELCDFLLSEKSNRITGKLISAIWDDFNGEEFISRLKSDKDFCTLRRIDSLNFDTKIKELIY